VAVLKKIGSLGIIVGGTSQTEVGDLDAFDAVFEQDVRWLDVFSNIEMVANYSKPGTDTKPGEISYRMRIPILLPAELPPTPPDEEKC
jgi:hypothetical protein